MPSAIEWTEETWNPVTGCSKVSPGCDHCYAETLSLRHGWSKLPWAPENAAENVVLHPDRLEKPLHWKKPRLVFVNSMSDMFHEEIPYEFTRETFNVMRRCDGGLIAATGRANPSHTFQILTKRPAQALKLWQERKLGFETWPPNVWLGVSIESWRFNWRADVLRRVPAAVRFISAEPLLDTLYPPEHPQRHLDLTGIEWVIVGGESGEGFRPMRAEWARELRDVCDDYEAMGQRTAFFFKQWGGRTPKAGGRLLDGREWNEMPGREL